MLFNISKPIGRPTLSELKFICDMLRLF